MKNSSKKNKVKKISDTVFDKMFDAGEDISAYLDTTAAIVVQRVNVDFPQWMIKLLDNQANQLNVSRQAVIKMWIRDRLELVYGRQVFHTRPTA
ncbi:MAG: hypothetical protein ACD_62C00120G0005 [uncultured bacterium]|nr:MAG: hypothetical protein ACD_62C00120G0005 [uncultured bacterium]HLD45169.1 hypothetical protein [bacterium]